MLLLIGGLFLAFSPVSVAPPLGATPALADELSSARTQLEEARAALKARQAELDQLAVQHERALSALEMTQDRIAEVQAELDRSNADLNAMQAKLQERVRRAYMNRGTESAAFLETLFAEKADFSTVINRLGLLGRVVRQDQDVFDQVERHVRKLNGLEAELNRQRAQEDEQVAQLDADNARALRVLEAASADYKALKQRVATLEEQERKRKEAEAKAAAEAAANNAPTPSGSGGSGSGTSGSGGSSGNSGYTKVVTGDWCFPVDGPCSFIDTWGAPRSGGRTHKGTDIMCRAQHAAVGGSQWQHLAHYALRGRGRRHRALDSGQRQQLLLLLPSGVHRQGHRARGERDYRPGRGLRGQHRQRSRRVGAPTLRNPPRERRRHQPLPHPERPPLSPAVRPPIAESAYQANLRHQHRPFGAVENLVAHRAQGQPGKSTQAPVADHDQCALLSR